MYQKFLIVLIVTVFYNGVTYSSPTEKKNLDVVLPEEKPPTALPTTTDSQFIKKTASTKNTVVHSSDQPSDVSTKKPVLPEHQVIAQNENQASNKTITPATADNSADLKNNTQSNNNKTTTPAPVNKNEDVSTGQVYNSSTTVPTGASTAVNLTTTKPKISTVTTATPSTTTKSTGAASDTTTTTTTTATQTTRVKSNVTADTPAPVQEKHFDGPSFIGGIVLTIGLTAIGFIAFKYYKPGMRMEIGVGKSVQISRSITQPPI